MFGIVELKDRVAAIEATIKGQSQLDRTALQGLIKDSAEFLQRLALAEAQIAKIQTRAADETRRNDETRTQVARLAKMLSEVVERQSKLSEDLMEVDRKVSKAAFPVVRHKPAPVGAVHIAEGMRVPVGPLSFERHEPTAKKHASEETAEGTRNGKRNRTRSAWPVRYKRWKRIVTVRDENIERQLMRTVEVGAEGVPYIVSMAKAALGSGIIDHLRRAPNAILPAPRLGHEAGDQKRNTKPHVLAIPDCEHLGQRLFVRVGFGTKKQAAIAYEQWPLFVAHVNSLIAAEGK